MMTVECGICGVGL